MENAEGKWGPYMVAFPYWWRGSLGFAYGVKVVVRCKGWEAAQYRPEYIVY